jgi:hypothetical protein
MLSTVGGQQCVRPGRIRLGTGSQSICQSYWLQAIRTTAVGVPEAAMDMEDLILDHIHL